MQCKKFIIPIIFVLLFAFFIRTNVKADSGTITLTDGCSIRLADPAGLRYSATVSGEFGNDSVYGFILLRGKVSRNHLISRYEAGTAAVVEVQPTDGQLAVSIVEIPTEDYDQDFSVLAFVNDNGVKTYSETVCTRNILEVAQAAIANGQENDFVNSIVNAYHEVTYHYNGPIVGYASLAAMESDFLSDFNSITGKSLTSASQIYNNAGTGFQTFFNDPEMNAKWIWIVEEFENLRKQGYGNHDICTTAYAHAKAMTMDSSLDDNIVYRQNVEGFFTLTKKATYSGLAAIDFSNLDVQLQMFNTMTKKVTVENDSALLPNPTRDGYTFNGWYSDSSCTVPASNVGSFSDIYAKWTMSDYSITYMDGSNLLDFSPSSYRINTTTFDLPDYNKSGYVFEGWYDNSSFEGNPVTAIEKGSFGNKVFYAKTTESSFTGVNVTFNTSGGLLPSSEVLDDPVRTINVSTYSNTGSASGIYLCSTAVTTNNSLRWQYKILLKYISEIDAYEVVAVDAATASANNAATAAGVTWTHALASASTNISTYASVGQYIKLSVDTLSINMDSFSAYAYNVLSFETLSTNITLAGPLPTPYREGYTFTGWLNSIDGLTYTEFPGYLENPGNITYTAQWEAN